MKNYDFTASHRHNWLQKNFNSYVELTTKVFLFRELRISFIVLFTEFFVVIVPNFYFNIFTFKFLVIDHSLFYVFSLDDIFKIDVRWTMWIYFFTSKCPIVALNIRSPRVDEYNAFSILFKKSNTVQWIILCIFTCESVQEFLWVLYPEMALLDRSSRLNMVPFGN